MVSAMSRGEPPKRGGGRTGAGSGGGAQRIGLTTAEAASQFFFTVHSQRSIVPADARANTADFLCGGRWRWAPQCASSSWAHGGVGWSPPAGQ